MGCCFSCICSDNSKEVELFSMEIINEGKVRKIYKCGSSIGPLVCKTIPIKTNSWKREIPTLKSLVGMDEYFQQFSHITRTETEICIFSRLVHGSDFYNYIDRNDFDECDAKPFMKELVKAVFKLHEHGIWHLDIKPENIVCRNEDLSDLVLIDFGHSLFHKREKNFILLNRGTTGYSSPEQLKGLCTAKGDVWSIGVTTYVAIFKRYPVKDYQKNISALTDPVLAELLHMILQKDVGQRISIEELYNHPWINK